MVPECLGTWRLNEGTVAALLWIDSQGEEKLGRKQFKAGEGSWNRSVPSRAGGKREVAVVTNSAVSGGEMGGLAIQGRACCACELSFVSLKKNLYSEKAPLFRPLQRGKDERGRLRYDPELPQPSSPARHLQHRAAGPAVPRVLHRTLHVLTVQVARAVELGTPSALRSGKALVQC